MYPGCEPVRFPKILDSYSIGSSRAPRPKKTGDKVAQWTSMNY
jgi:hypothetical protein